MQSKGDEFVKRRTYFFEDPVNDEFSGVGKRRKITVGKDFRYLPRNVFWRIARFFVYRVIMTPFAYLFCHLQFRMKVIGKEKLRPYRKTGYFLYGNHTQIPGDGFIHNVLTFPTDAYVVVNPDNIAVRGTKNLMMMLGTLPTPTDFSGFKNFTKAIETRIEQGHAVVIYPEAHIWPYYTGIRPFPMTSFHYPISCDAPTFCFTVTYRRSKHGRARIVTYVDGPFTGEGETARAKQRDLHQKVYETMCMRAAIPENYAFHDYIPKEKSEETP